MCGVVFEADEELRNGEFDQGDAVEYLPKTDVNEDEDELQRIGESFEKMENRLVETENMADHETDDRGTAHDGKYTESDTQGNAPGQSLRRGALLELVRDRADDPAVEAAIWVEGHERFRICDTRNQKTEFGKRNEY